MLASGARREAVSPVLTRTARPRGGWTAHVDGIAREPSRVPDVGRRPGEARGAAYSVSVRPFEGAKLRAARGVTSQRNRQEKRGWHSQGAAHLDAGGSQAADLPVPREIGA